MSRMSRFMAGSLVGFLGLSLALVGASPGLAKDRAQPNPDSSFEAIDFGNDSSQWANDGECDDPRFTGPGTADELVDDDLKKDASDCAAALTAGTVTLIDDAGSGSVGGGDVAPPTAVIDFGNDSSQWANDGECDDPRFTGPGTADELVDDDLKKDASDCTAAFNAGTISLIDDAGSVGGGDVAPPTTVIDFGNDSSQWANDGECDDPRFTGPGTADELLDDDLKRDASDCTAAFNAGTISLIGDNGATDGAKIPPAVKISDIDFGDNSSQWAKDDECDDPRFEGPGVVATPLLTDVKRDASDCLAAVQAGMATYMGEKDPNAIDFGSDFSQWANDGECDDPRFTGAGVAKKLFATDMLGDASDCQALFDAGTIAIRQVYSPTYAAGAPYDASHIDFGDNSSSYAKDGECDDPRFEGPGAAPNMRDSDLLADADDCRTAYEQGMVMLIETN